MARSTQTQAFLPALALPALQRASSQLCRRRPFRCLTHHVTPRASVVVPGTVPTDQLLKSFSAAVRGEWVGYEGTFDPATAKAEPIPDYYIPEQFLEWDLIPLGFETNHSAIVRGNTLYRKFFRILPTVSHFGDHVDTEEDITQFALDGGPDAAAIFPDGSFIAGPANVSPTRTSRLDKWPSVSFCLQDPRDDHRRAVNLWVRFDFEKRAFAAPVRAILERWSCDHCDGADLDGSSGFVDGWSSGSAGNVTNLMGEWALRRETAYNAERNIDDPILLRGDEDDADASLYLPEGIDLSVYGDAENGVIVRAGWLVDEDTRVVLQRTFAETGTVVQSERFVERRLS